MMQIGYFFTLKFVILSGNSVATVITELNSTTVKFSKLRTDLHAVVMTKTQHKL